MRRFRPRSRHSTGRRGELNRYPDGGAYRLRAALAELHDVPLEQVAIGGGADGVIDCLAQAALEPGDEIVCGWPSFPSYVIDALKLGAEPKRVPLRDHRHDLDAMLAAIGPRTKIAFLCHPNNPTGTVNTRSELDAWFERVPEHVLSVLDQAYFEYVDDPEYPDGIARYAKAGRNVRRAAHVLQDLRPRGLRVGYGVGPAEVVAAVGKVRRAFDITTPAQEAALASLGDPDEIARRRAAERARAVPHSRRCSASTGSSRCRARSRTSSTWRRAGTRPTSSSALLREGVIVRPLGGFGAPEAIRITVGTPEENAFFAAALGRVLSSVHRVADDLGGGLLDPQVERRLAP